MGNSKARARKKLVVVGLCCSGALLAIIVILKTLEGLGIRDLRHEPSHNLVLIGPGIPMFIVSCVLSLIALLPRKHRVEGKLRTVVILNTGLLIALLLAFAAGCLDPYASYRPPCVAASVSTVRTISSAQDLYRRRYGTYGTLAQLGEAGMIDPVLASGTRREYRFTIENVTDSSYCCYATPVIWGEEVIKHKHWVERVVTKRNFMMCQDGVIKWNDMQGNTTDWRSLGQ
jgi:hypothetical protein